MRSSRRARGAFGNLVRRYLDFCAHHILLCRLRQADGRTGVDAHRAFRDARAFWLDSVRRRRMAALHVAVNVDVRGRAIIQLECTARVSAKRTVSGRLMRI